MSKLSRGFGVTPGQSITAISRQEPDCTACKSVRAYFELDAFSPFGEVPTRGWVTLKNQRIYFCQQLADWLHSETWHFTTLLATCIESVANLAKDSDALISELLVEFPDKPCRDAIFKFLTSNTRVRSWFQFSPTKPEVVSFNLSPSQANELKPHLPVINTAGDLAKWLKLTTCQLEWLADLKRHDQKDRRHLQHYHYSVIDKRHGSKRLIESPKTRLKMIQRKINDNILAHASMHESAHGFRKSRSCISHAARHVKKEYVFVFDLAHCFPSVQWRQIYQVFRGFGYAVSVSKYLTALCTHQSYPRRELISKLDNEQQSLLKYRHLPQGAPSSPALSNAVLFRLDKRLAGLAKSLNLVYSRYADDMVLSGSTHRNWQFLEPLVGSICLEQGFTLNYRKSRTLRPQQRQKITGVVVNEKLNIDRRDYDRLKAILTNCARHGLQSQNHANHPDFRAYLLGSIQHVKSLNESKGNKLESIYARV